MKSDVQGRSSRTWQVIAQELAAERDSQRVLELSLELSASLEPRRGNNGHRPQPDHPDGANDYVSLRSSVHTASLLHSTIEASAADFGNIQLFDLANRTLTIVAHCGFGEEFLSYYETVRFDDDCSCAAAFSADWEESRSILWYFSIITRAMPPVPSSPARLTRPPS